MYSDTTEIVDRVTGEVCPPLSGFTYYEFASNNKGVFRRGIIRQDLRSWVDENDNTGIYRSIYPSNTDQMLDSNEENLFYGNLCFDLDTHKNKVVEQWPALIRELQDKLIPALRADFDLRETDLQIWFSGGRGIHLEVPASALGIWPDHNLNIIQGFYAKELKQKLDLSFIDLSLYSTKRLYRMEYSQHQESGLYKQPLRFEELAAVADSFSWMEKFSKAPRKKLPEELFTVPNPTSKAYSFYATLVRNALNTKRTFTPTTTIQRNRLNYDRSRFKCVEKMMSPGETVPGGRNTMAFYFTNHLADNGFSFEEAKEEMEIWANEHCDPPMISKTERAEWMLILERAYEDRSEGPRPGCRYIQQNFPSLCQESICPIASVLRRSHLLSR